MRLKHESVFPLVKSLNADGAGRKSLATSQLDDIELYTLTTEKLPILINSVGNVMKTLKNSSLLRTYIPHQCKDVSEEAVGCVCRSLQWLCIGNLGVFEQVYVSYTHVKYFSVADIFFSCMALYSYKSNDKKACWLGLKVFRAGLSKTCWNNLRKLIPISRRRW